MHIKLGFSESGVPFDPIRPLLTPFFFRDLRVIEESFLGLKKKYQRGSIGFEESFKGVLNTFQECFACVSIMFQKKIPGVSGKFQ